MNIITNLSGRLRNTPLPVNDGLFPVFEAVINSIHSIEEIDMPITDGNICVEIIRDKQQEFSFEEKKRGPVPCREIIGFKISDNGIGFNEDNMNSFLTLDSDYKSYKGCRGIGRLLWLKAFDMAIISSLYKDKNNLLKLKSFKFTAKDGISEEKIQDSEKGTIETNIHLSGFSKKYRNCSRKTTKAIAYSLFEHCLWYFIRKEGVPKIFVKDDDEKILLNDMYSEFIVSAKESELLKIKNETFELIHIKTRTNISGSHAIAFCAANRLVKEENISNAIPGLYNRLHDDSGEFTYKCYVISDFLTDSVRADRTGFDISESESEDMFSGTEISLKEIRNALIKQISIYLSKYIKENKEKSENRIQNFVSQKAPRYRPILSRIPEEKLCIDPNISDKDLEVVLHKHLAEIEENFIIDGHNIMEIEIGKDGLEDYQKRIKKYLSTLEDIKKSDLANYVSHRKVILDIFEKAIKLGKNGKYQREEVIHNLIFPMGHDSNELTFDEFNLWIIDERLAFHNYLASDKAIKAMPISDSKDIKRPDILALNIFDNPILVAEGEKIPMASIVIVEIKRPMRDDASYGEEQDPIKQTMGYLKKIRSGTVLTSSGRPILGTEQIPGFCYIICDITQSIKDLCADYDAIKTSDGMGYFFFHKSYSVYVEVISFDRLLNAAKERNRAFFDKLGLPST
ncbi:MAG: ATP-binding protein [Candidatus Brocadiae bacterium]|nr:ATP-binding protein [Candidatus Brocadiia bacterium]